MKRVTMCVSNNQGYADDQPPTSLNLFDLQRMVERAIEDYGGESVVVTYDSGNRYGANWGSICNGEEIMTYEDLKQEWGDE